MNPPFVSLTDVISDEVFPRVDVQLRAGRHIDQGDREAFEFLLDARDHLEPFYKRFGAELIHKSDGYFFLLTSGAMLTKRSLSKSEMLVGQVLALLRLDPSTLKSGGTVTRDVILDTLVRLVGEQHLVRTITNRKGKYNEQVAAEEVRNKVKRALTDLKKLGFIELHGEYEVELRPALMRFIEPVRGVSNREEAMKKLITRGEVTTADDQALDDVSHMEMNA